MKTKIRDVIQRTWNEIAGDWCKDMDDEPSNKGLTEAVFDADRWRFHGDPDHETTRQIEMMTWEEKVAATTEAIGG